MVTDRDARSEARGMSVVLIGLSHQVAPLELREKLHAGPDARTAHLQALVERGVAREAVEISTCNRVELVVSLDGTSAEQVIQTVARLRDVDSLSIARHSYQHSDVDAWRHLFRVTSGLDSMVLGEPQITGQVKAAYQHGCDAGTVGPNLHRLFHKAFFAAKRVRSETDVGRHAVGIAYAAVQLARRIFDELATKSVLLIGTGEMGQLAVRHFREQGVKSVTIASRTASRAAEVAEELDAEPTTWENLDDAFLKADAVVAATDAGTPLLGRANAERLMRARRGRPIFLIDISVPRVFDNQASEVGGVYLFDVDDLEQVIEENREQRRQAAQDAEDLLESELRSFERELASARVAPLVRSLHMGFEEDVAKEVDRTVSRLRERTGVHDDQLDELRDALMAMGGALRKRWLAAPVGVLKSLGRDGRVGELDVARRVLGLEDVELEIPSNIAEQAEAE